ncbi:MAG: cold shock domain-containing protein [Caldilineaceae bacterium]|nr:cold shock domain-containing protein [Caldilineaceae bacterium]
MSKPKLQDQTLFCSRCGISFVWSVQEQDADGAAEGNTTPRFCPGCRYLLPGENRERGLVKWYNVRKRYGFITRAEGADLFVHGSALSKASRLHPGDLVEFDVEADPRGPTARSVKILVQADKSVT